MYNPLLVAAQQVLDHVEDDRIPRVHNQCTLCHTYRKVLRDAIADATVADSKLVRDRLELLKALKLVKKVLLVSDAPIKLSEVISLADELGLNPWCIKEGRADADSEYYPDFIDEAIAKAERALDAK